MAGKIMPWEPWEGENYPTTKVLILGESAYSWIDEKSGEVVPLLPHHPGFQLQHWIEHFPKQRYFSLMSRALCGKYWPRLDDMKDAWNEYAYTLFVQGTVGLGARTRPSPAQWDDARVHFRTLIERIRPLRVIVTGKDMWNRHMEGCDGPHLSDDIQAYKLKDGSLVWCLAVPHPSNSRVGFSWEKVGESIRNFRSAELPARA